MSIKNEIKKRRNLMKRLIIRGLNNFELATSLKISVGQIKRDKLVIKKEIIGEVETTNINELIGEIREQSKEVMRQAWRMFNNETTTEKGKLHSLRIILEAMDKQFKAMTGIGLMEAGNQMGLTQNNVTFSIVQILQEIKDEEKQDQKVIDVPKIK